MLEETKQVLNHVTDDRQASADLSNHLQFENNKIEITSWKARAYGEVSEIERVSAANE